MAQVLTRTWVMLPSGVGRGGYWPPCSASPFPWVVLDTSCSVRPAKLECTLGKDIDLAYKSREHTCVHVYVCVHTVGINVYWCLGAWCTILVSSLPTVPLLCPSSSTATVGPDRAPPGSIRAEGGRGDRGWL